MATRFNISVPKKYTKDGQEKTAWKTVGTLVHFPATANKTEGYIMELFMLPDVTFKVFPEKDREQHTQASAPAQDSLRAFDNAVDGIDPESIPF